MDYQCTEPLRKSEDSKKWVMGIPTALKIVTLPLLGRYETRYADWWVVQEHLEPKDITILSLNSDYTLPDASLYYCADISMHMVND